MIISAYKSKALNDLEKTMLSGLAPKFRNAIDNNAHGVERP